MMFKEIVSKVMRPVMFIYAILICGVEIVWFILCTPWKIVKCTCCFTWKNLNSRILKNQWIARGFLCGLGFWIAAFVVRFIERLF